MSPAIRWWDGLGGFGWWHRDLLNPVSYAQVATQHEEQEQQEHTIDQRNQIDLVISKMERQTASAHG